MFNQYPICVSLMQAVSPSAFTGQTYTLSWELTTSLHSHRQPPMPRGQKNASALWLLDFSSKPRPPFSTTLIPITWGTISLSQKVSIVISVSLHLISQRISNQPHFLLAPREQPASQNIRPHEVSGPFQPPPQIEQAQKIPGRAWALGNDSNSQHC